MQNGVLETIGEGGPEPIPPVQCQNQTHFAYQNVGKGGNPEEWEGETPNLLLASVFPERSYAPVIRDNGVPSGGLEKIPNGCGG